MRREVLEDYETIRLTHDPERRILSASLDYPGRPVFTLGMLAELCRVHADLALGRIRADYLLWDSTFEGVLGYGGDLQMFATLVRGRDEATMRRYGKRAVDAVHGNAALFPRHDVETVTCMRGDALGGGLEAALSSHTVVAERGTSLGFPEIGFNMFPGMGALDFVAARTDLRTARMLLLDPRPRSAEEMHDMGIVDILAPDGRGRETALEYVEDCMARGPSSREIRRSKALDRLPDYEGLLDIVHEWAACSTLVGRTDLRKMDRLTGAQLRRTDR